MKSEDWMPTRENVLEMIKSSQLDPQSEIMRLRKKGTKNLDQNNYQEAAKNLKEALDIAEKQPMTRYSYSTIIGLYGQLASALGYQDDRDNELIYLKRAIEIGEEHIPGTLELGIYYGNIAINYRDRGDLELALKFYQKSIEIKEKELSPDHSNIVYLCYSIAKVATNLKKYDLALSYIDKSIQKNPNYQYGYHLKGLILQEQSLSLQGQAKKDLLEQSLASYKKALELDPNYGDAKIDKLKAEALLLELEKDQSKRVSKVQALRLELSAAQTQKKPDDYDQKKKLELQKASKDGMRAEIPETEFEIGSPRYKEELNKVLERVSNLERRVDKVESDITEIKDRVHILEDRVYSLMDVLAIIDKSQLDLDEKIKEGEKSSYKPTSSTTPPSDHDKLLIDLKAQKEDLDKRKQQIKEFNKNDDLRHYFFTLLTELEAAYIAARAIQSNKIDIASRGKFATPAKYIAGVVALAPIFGHAAAGTITGIASVADIYEDVKDIRNLSRIATVAINIEDFDEIAIKLAIKMTLRREEELKKLKGEEVSVEIRDCFRSLKSKGLAGMFANFVEDNKTKAKLRGRADAYQIIAGLQLEGVAENLRVTEDKTVTDEDGRSKLKTSPSFISDELVDIALKPPSTLVSKASATNKNCCVIL